MYYDSYDSYYLDSYNRKNCNYKNNQSKILTVDGTGSIKATPDTASIVLGVQTENIDLKTAQNENAIISTKVINSLKSIGINEKNMSTASYTIEPIYDYVDGKQIFRTYRVTNNIRTTTKSINNIGEIVDTATANGVNLVNNITFFLSDPAPYYRKALNLAVEDVLMKARAISNSIGVTLNEPPINIVQKNLDLSGSSPKTAVAFSAASTPILSGQLDLNANITAAFTYQ